jgi:hypothetical protein
MPGLGPGLLERLFAGEWSASEAQAKEAAEGIRAHLL